jgi:phosphate starvation-inducible protein PhoH
MKNKNKEDKSVIIPQRTKINYDLDIYQRSDLTEKQKTIYNTCTNKQTKCVMIDGLWGTGKSYLFTLAAIKLLNEQKISNIYYIRNPITASINSQVGFLSGDLSEKMAPYNVVLYDKLNEILSKENTNKLLKENRIECIPTGFLQGRSFNCSCLIVDEAASMSLEDLMLIVSRCGHFTKIFICGDTLNQVYLSNKSGFKSFFDIFNDDESKANGIFTFKLQEETDIIRSDFLRFIMKKVNKIPGKNPIL